MRMGGTTFCDAWILIERQHFTFIYLYVDDIKLNFGAHPGGICTL